MRQAVNDIDYIICIERQVQYDRKIEHSAEAIRASKRKGKDEKHQNVEKIQNSFTYKAFSRVRAGCRTAARQVEYA